MEGSPTSRLFEIQDYLHDVCHLREFETNCTLFVYL